MIMKMDTPKKNNKKYFLVIILTLIFVSSCCLAKKELFEKNFKFIHAGLSTDQIKRRLGTPSKIFKGQKEIQKLLQEDAETDSEDRWASEYPEIYDNFYKSEKEEERAIKQLKQSKDIFCYEYLYRYDNSSTEQKKWHIYFIKNKVIWMSFP